MNDQDEKATIWEGDRLGRRHEADTIEAFLTKEVEVFRRLGRDQSIVLGIDAPYGLGKSWFLERLAKQLELSHPVARIDAWADDVGDEPLTAFMAAIDDALAPYLKVSKKLGDKMAAVKAAAFPVIGKLLSGVAIKAASKIAGDEIENQLGTTIEDAIRGTKQNADSDKDGAAAAAMTEAFEKLGSEIDGLVDRRGAAMLAAYRQRKESRTRFRQNMRDLVPAIDKSDGPGKSPLIVIIDELDRCRPNYAIRMLEEIKHFFEVPGVVFILALHGGQLSKSVNAIYGAGFDSEDYLRRFFTRRYELRPVPIVELVATVFEEWGIDENRFSYPIPIGDRNYTLTNPRLIGLILAEQLVTPREVYPIMDALRLFVDGWEHPEPIEPMAVLNLLVNLVRGLQVDFVQDRAQNQLLFKGVSWENRTSSTPKNFTLKSYLERLNMKAWTPLREINTIQYLADSSHNYLVDWLSNELRSRCERSHQGSINQSHFADYIPRIMNLARFIDKKDVDAEQSLPG